jgi:hypothetical protein
VKPRREKPTHNIAEAPPDPDGVIDGDDGDGEDGE